MTTNRANFDPKASDSAKPEDDKKEDSGLIDTTATAGEDDKKEANEPKTGKKLSQEELLEKTKAKIHTQDAEKIEEGFAFVHIPYSGSGSVLPVEKRNVQGIDLHVLPVSINGKEYLIEVNKQVKVPTEVKEAIENTTHRGTRAQVNEPTLLR